MCQIGSRGLDRPTKSIVALHDECTVVAFLRSRRVPHILEHGAEVDAPEATAHVPAVLLGKRLVQRVVLTQRMELKHVLDVIIKYKDLFESKATCQQLDEKAAKTTLALRGCGFQGNLPAVSQVVCPLAPARQ